MTSKLKRPSQDLGAMDCAEEKPKYVKPDITTYTSDELEDIIGPAITGSGAGPG